MSPPAGVRFHPGHTWVRLIGFDLALVGATDFAANFAGNLAGISLPRESRLLGAGGVAWTFISDKGRRLAQVAPIGGQVLAVNSDLVEDIGGLARSPYNHGWVLCLQSATIPDQMRNLLSHEADQLRFDRTCSTITRVLGSALRLPFRDGKWSPAFGDELSDEEWEALRHELFPAYRDHSLPKEIPC